MALICFEILRRYTRLVMQGAKELECLLQQLFDGSQNASQAVWVAMRAAVFPAGARLRPRLCLAVAHSLAPDVPLSASSLRAAMAVELLHCASLVHDDLPCFDNALSRRGAPSIQAQFGESMAVLVGNGLSFLAFQQLSYLPGDVAASMLDVLSASALHLVQGQSQECLSELSGFNMVDYHHDKTAALFEAAAVLGALSVCHQVPAVWGALGRVIGKAYQLADDVQDMNRDKPVYNACSQYGREPIYNAFVALLQEAQAIIAQQGVAVDSAIGQWLAALTARLEHALFLDTNLVVPKASSYHASEGKHEISQ
jgi:geranylgeranyl diphosphate synthase type II